MRPLLPACKSQRSGQGQEEDADSGTILAHCPLRCVGPNRVSQADGRNVEFLQAASLGGLGSLNAVQEAARSAEPVIFGVVVLALSTEY